MTEARPDPLLRDQFLGGMSNAACTVSVVTTDGPGGRAGVTVSAMASVSADTPQPTLLVCVHHLSKAAEAIIENGSFCVNVLRDEHWYVSDCFAGRYRTADGDKFSCTNWTVDANGSPRVSDALVAFSCDLASWQKVGTHHVFIGSVREVFSGHPGSALIYANRAYGTPLRRDTSRTAVGTNETLRLGVFHTFGPYIVPQVLDSMKASDRDTGLTLVEGDQTEVLRALRMGEVDVALLYDIGLREGCPQNVLIERLSVLKPYVLLAEEHLLSKFPMLSLADLVEWPLVLLDAPPSGEYFLSLFQDEGMQPNIGFRSRSFEMVRGLVAHGFGYSLLATKPASSTSYDGRALTTRPLQDEVLGSHLAIAYRKDGALQTTMAFVDECRKLIARVGAHGPFKSVAYSEARVPYGS
jgi:flavin reductase (DIM6/NTAB) family NADH-FMN oxidoreductase RutF/DNA-binding transcriptional LysR family regulator